MGQDGQIGVVTGTLTWALCVSTYNRVDLLEVCVRHALAQTRLPSEIVIVDASPDWDGNSRRIVPMAEAAGVPIQYLPAPKKSLPAQRNHGIKAASADILFLIDDDAFLHSDCAEAIMAVYEADRDQRVAAVSASDAPLTGADGPAAGVAAAGKTGASKARLTEVILSRSSLARFLWVELLMMSADRVFIPYDGRWHVPDEATVAASGLGPIHAVKTIGGYRMTVRRAMALAEPFDNDLLAYASAEDLDATYRFSRHGWIVQAQDARIYHHEAMAGRLKREQSTMLGVLNVAFLLRKHSNTPVRSMIQFYVMLLRRLNAEFLKDLLSRRWAFRQFRTMCAAVPVTLGIMRQDRSTLGPYYAPIQRRVLGLPPLSQP
ncbi:glycosyltransferase family 2 protein [Rhodobacter sp. SY28-1]|uniref:glycosyltransferase family 2 protein n=1 Tax=Rhodobacter sp. SY28-1 TaxID=2562317 RepID=UPI0010BFD578|nr:glycosyltransferase [Rhodobacter sp. SY28-1]